MKGKKQAKHVRRDAKVDLRGQILVTAQRYDDHGICIMSRLCVLPLVSAMSVWHHRHFDKFHILPAYLSPVLLMLPTVPVQAYDVEHVDSHPMWLMVMLICAVVQ